MLSNLIFIIPILGLTAGLSLSVTIPIFIIGTLYAIRNDMEIAYRGFKMEFALLLLLAVSCLWSINISSSITSVAKIFSLSFVSYILITNEKLVLDKLSIKSNILLLSIIFALAVFYVELIGGGAISSWFRDVMQRKESHEFYLHYLDRGCSLLAMFAWLVIAQLLKEDKKIEAILLYIVVFITLYLSDSLSGFVGFILGGFVFLLTRYSFFSNPKFLSSILIAGVTLFLCLAVTMKPYKLSDEMNFLPMSAKHRLFIWNFTADKAYEKPVLGWGHNSSRDFDIKESDMIDYANHVLSPLPVHPHNNILQILLENGFIGFVIYMALICRYLFLWNNLFCNTLTNQNLAIRSSGYACFATFFIISMISFNMWQSWWICSYLWIAILFSMQAAGIKLKHERA